MHSLRFPQLYHIHLLFTIIAELSSDDKSESLSDFQVGHHFGAEVIKR
jgi:hypothetical protein